MDIAKLLGIVIGAVLLAFGLAKVIPILTLVGFVIMAVSMLSIALTAYAGASHGSNRPHA